MSLNETLETAKQRGASIQGVGYFQLQGNNNTRAMQSWDWAILESGIMDLRAEHSNLSEEPVNESQAWREDMIHTCWLKKLTDLFWRP